MKLSLVGGVPEAQLVAALAKAKPGDYTTEERNTLAWVNLPDATEATLKAVQAALGKPLTVIEVELPPGANGVGVKGRRYTIPATKPLDLTKAMTETLRDWTANRTEDSPPFEDDASAHDLALAFAEDVQPPPPPPAIPMGGGAMPLKRKGTGAAPAAKPLYEKWANALIASLTASEGIETTGDALPIRRIAALLEAHDDSGKVVPAFGEALLDLLVDDDAVEEVFADEAAIVAAATSSRPR